jgi:AcrR family transcriptional regulator
VPRTNGADEANMIERERHGTRQSSAGGPRRSTQKAQAREDDIYRAAARIFHRKGYAATSLQDIADEVGLLKGSLYYYIDSKEDLLFGITETIHRLAASVADATAALDDGPSEKLRFLVEQHVASFGVNLQMIRVFYTEYEALGPDRRRVVINERRRYESAVLGLIEDGQRDGEFCPDLDARVANNAVLTMVNTIYMWFDDRRDDLPAIAEQYASMVLGSLRCPPEHDHPPAVSAAARPHPTRRSPRR